MKKGISRVSCYIGGIFLIAVGVNISKHAGLGISPVASLPYAVELIWGIELGLATAIVYVFLILLQMLLLRQFRPHQFLQLGATVLMSGATTLASVQYLLGWLPAPESYLASLWLLLISILMIGVGVYLYIKPDLVPLPSEGLAKALVSLTHSRIPFHLAKIIVDCGLIVSAAILSIAMLGKVAAVGEGTVLTALLVGKTVGFCHKIEQKYHERRQGKARCLP